MGNCNLWFILSVFLLVRMSKHAHILIVSSFIEKRKHIIRTLFLVHMSLKQFHVSFSLSLWSFTGLHFTVILSFIQSPMNDYFSCFLYIAIIYNDAYITFFFICGSAPSGKFPEVGLLRQWLNGCEESLDMAKLLSNGIVPFCTSISNL